ncbi:MAG TPA: T9SS type A sorting domain-containing protein [archaeon]|nr:T9SS type A sorting domain-containing protein [archaeon]
MKCLLKVTKIITLLSFLVVISSLQVYAQNTAPVPSTFDILSPADGNLSLQINHSYGTASGKNHRIFYGGDFWHVKGNADAVSVLTHAFKGWKDAGGTVDAYDSGEEYARGNYHKSRLTLGGTKDDDLYGLTDDPSKSRVVALPGSSTNATSYDADDLGTAATLGATTGLDYSGENGFIAINEEDTLTIRFSGYVDPNNRMVYSTVGGGADLNYSGSLLKSKSYAFDIGNPANDGENGVRYGVIPSTLPDGASFNGNLFVWVPNFIQGDGDSDNSLHNGIYFVDANISNGSTASELTDAAVGLNATAGPRVGELKDSLYVVYFSATDDGIPPKTGIDSLFILVNDSIANPGPVFTSRVVVNRNGQNVTYNQQIRSINADSALNYNEGDSIFITFNATDLDSARGGGENERLEITVEEWSDFQPSEFVPTDWATALKENLDSVALDTASVSVNGKPRALKVRLQVAFNIADDPDVIDRIIIKVKDEHDNIARDTMQFSIHNLNRKPIWDADTSRKPSDSTMVFAYSPELVEPDSVSAIQPIGVSSGKTDSIYFTRYVYDPDPYIDDQLGPAISFTQSGAPNPIWSTSGLMILSLESEDTVSYPFTITAKDSYTADQKSAIANLILRVAPEPVMAEIYPHLGYPGQDVTIFGEGFGLFDEASTTPSKVVFRARNTQGQAQNIRATINSWSRDRINLTIPRSVPESRYVAATSLYIPDTVEVYSAVFSDPAYYPYVIEAADTMSLQDIEIANVTSTSAQIKWRTAFTGSDSLVLAQATDTLNVFGATIFTESGTSYYWPTFVIWDPITPGFSSTPAAVRIYKGSTASSDQMHIINITDLAPSTLYKFILAMENKLFYGDSTHNVNGPYVPIKIDRSNVNNGSVSGFRFMTLPEQNANGATHVITGKVFTSTGAAINCQVSVKIISHTETSDTSLAIATIVGSDSSWVLNLGNAVMDTIGVSDRAFPWAVGDYLLVTVGGDKDVGFTQFVSTVTSSLPQVVNQSLNGTLIAASVNYDLRFKTGLNLIGVPVNLFSTEPQTSDDLLNTIQGGVPSISKWLTGLGLQNTRVKAVTVAGGFLGDAEFDLELYEGYFVSVDQQEFVTLRGSIFSDTLPVKVFDQGGGLYWISRPAQVESKFYAWSARTMLAPGNIPYATEIFRYNEDYQQYETAAIDPSTGAFIADMNFHIDVSEGYILRLTQNSQWDIDTPSSVLLANASAAFDNITAVAPSLTLNIGASNASSGAVRNIRLTDVTSSAATISWITNGAGTAQVRYGKAAEGLNKVASFNPGLVTGGMRVVKLLGLEPETEYICEIVSDGITYNNNGQPFAFKSAKIGIGIPYTVFGRLVNEEGAPLAKAMVYVEVRGGDNLSEPLMAITNELGYWNVNLANLKTAAEGTVYEWNAGDEIRVTAVYEDASTSFRALVSGESPQNVVRITDNNGVAQEKKEAAKVALPKVFGMAQNYPNPFNPSTTIAYDIPETTQGVNVELKVYNLRGQTVRTLVNELKVPGHYVVQWNGENDNSEPVSSGVYFYRIKAGDYVATRKMVLLK